MGDDDKPLEPGSRNFQVPSIKEVDILKNISLTNNDTIMETVGSSGDFVDTTCIPSTTEVIPETRVDPKVCLILK